MSATSIFSDIKVQPRVGPRRFVYSGIPSGTQQRNMRFQVLENDSHKEFRIQVGKGSSLRWKLVPKGDSQEELHAERMPTLPPGQAREDSDEGKEVASGAFQMHKSNGDEIYGTMQDGKSNSTIRLTRQPDGNGWSVKMTKPPKSHGQSALDFVSAMKSKTAAVWSPANLSPDGKPDIKVDALEYNSPSSLPTAFPLPQQQIIEPARPEGKYDIGPAGTASGNMTLQPQPWMSPSQSAQRTPEQADTRSRFLKMTPQLRAQAAAMDKFTYPLTGDSLLKQTGITAGLGLLAGAGYHGYKKLKQLIGAEEDDGSTLAGDSLRFGLLGAAVPSAYRLGNTLLGNWQSSLGAVGDSTVNDWEKTGSVKEALSASSSSTADVNAAVYGTSPLDFRQVIAAIRSDSSLAPMQKQQLIEMSREASRKGLHADPQALMSAGMAALAGYIMSKLMGMHGVESAAMAGIGGVAGYALGQSSPYVERSATGYRYQD